MFEFSEMQVERQTCGNYCLVMYGQWCTNLAEAKLTDNGHGGVWLIYANIDSSTLVNMSQTQHV